MPALLYRFLATFLSIMLLSACATSGSSAPATPGQFVQRTLEVDGVAHAYQVFVPAARTLENDNGQRPVILFLHGSGERGGDGIKQTEVGLGPHVLAHAMDFPAIVVFPQSPAERFWKDDVADMAFAMLDAATREFNGDPDRSYLTGLSLGGYGTWELALMQPRRFAALVPVCGGITPPRADITVSAGPVAGEADPFAATARRLREIPAWIFHGALDDVVPPEQSRRMHEALQAQGANVRYTEFPDANHNSWDATYASPELWAWLFEQTRTP